MFPTLIGNEGLKPCKKRPFPTMIGNGGFEALQKRMFPTLIGNGGLQALAKTLFRIGVENGRRGPTLKPNSVKSSTCQGRNYFYLGFPNSILKPTFLNVCGLPFNAQGVESRALTRSSIELYVHVGVEMDVYI